MNRGNKGGNKMPTEAEKKANIKWKRNNTTQINIRFYNKTEQELIDYIKSSDNVQGMIKQAIREYKERHQ